MIQATSSSLRGGSSGSSLAIVPPYGGLAGPNGDPNTSVVAYKGHYAMFSGACPLKVKGAFPPPLTLSQRPDQFDQNMFHDAKNACRQVFDLVEDMGMLEELLHQLLTDADAEQEQVLLLTGLNLLAD